MVKARGWLAIATLHKICAVRIRSLTLPAPFQYHLQSMNSLFSCMDADTEPGSVSDPRMEKGLSCTVNVFAASLKKCALVPCQPPGEFVPVKLTSGNVNCTTLGGKPLRPAFCG